VLAHLLRIPYMGPWDLQPLGGFFFGLRFDNYRLRHGADGTRNSGHRTIFSSLVYDHRKGLAVSRNTTRTLCRTSPDGRDAVLLLHPFACLFSAVLACVRHRRFAGNGGLRRKDRRISDHESSPSNRTEPRISAPSNRRVMAEGFLSAWCTGRRYEKMWM
jgi:hypothetical protein